MKAVFFIFGVILTMTVFAESAQAASWVRCASENGVCRFSGTRRVLYGVNLGSNHVIKIATNQIRCSNSVFGDPARGKRKYCFYESVTVNQPVTTTTLPPVVTTTTLRPVTTTTLAPVTTTTVRVVTTTTLPPVTTTTIRVVTTTTLPPVTTTTVPSSSGVVQPNMLLIPVGDPGLSGPVVGYNAGQVPPQSPDIGAFRTVCLYSHMATVDPIVFPGQPGASHLHTFFGNTAADAYSTPESLRARGNSTCRGGTLNNSAYWIPSVIDTTNGVNRPLAPRTGNFYYKTGYHLRSGSDASIRAFPPGHRMIVGNARATSAQDNVVNYYCDRLSDGYHYNNGASIPQCNMGDELVMTIEFPQCGNGQLDSADHKSHMAYPVQGVCPASHPVPHPAVSLNVSWPVNSDTRNWRLSSDAYAGGPGGYSAHADWMNGWSLNFTGTVDRPLPAQSAMEFFVRNVINIRGDGGSHRLGLGYTKSNPNER